MREKLKEIVEQYKKIHKSGLDLKCFDNFSDLEDDFKQSSMFQEKKLAIIDDIFTKPDFKEKFLAKKEEFLKSDSIILIYQQGEINKKDSLFKFFKENSESQEFELLSGQKLKNWLKKEFEKYKTETEPGVLEALVEYVGSDLWRQSLEIKKLISYKNKGLVKKEDVKLLVRSKIETDIFKTIDAVADKNKKQALNLLHKHLEKGDSPLYLLAMINYQFRNLLVVKDFIEKKRHQFTNYTRMTRINVLSKELKMHPFVIRKTFWQARKFTLEELKKIYRKIFQVDLDIKTGKIEPKTALELLITGI